MLDECFVVINLKFCALVRDQIQLLIFPQGSEFCHCNKYFAFYVGV